MKKLIYIFAAFLVVINANAQSLEDIKNQMVKDWQRAKEYTLEYLNTMPADKYTFKATDSVRSFAQQMLHLANGNVFLVSQSLPNEPRPSWFSFTLEQRASAHAKDSVVKYVSESYDWVIKTIQNTPTGKWNEKTKVFGSLEETAFNMLNKAFEHQSHHRGQTTIYIRLVGVRPPQERLF